VLFITTILLVALSVVMVYSASAPSRWSATAALRVPDHAGHVGALGIAMLSS
jgi:p-aminobenzoyl-glutamate transporter AbgT